MGTTDGARRSPSDGGASPGPPEPGGRRPWLVRLRWRLAGATAGPAFAIALLAEVLLLRHLPIAGDDRPTWFGALLLAGFLNLLCVTLVGVVGGALLRRRDRSLPALVARDRAGTVAILACVVLVAVAGFAHRGRLAAEREDVRAAVQAVRVNVATSAPPEFRGAASRLDVRKQGGTGLYRACASGPTEREAYCVWVDTDERPPGLSVDDDRTPNSRRAGFGAAGPVRLP